MRVAVVGHLEWAEFLLVPRVPSPGAIVPARTHWEAPAGGGTVAAVQLARLSGECDFFTALEDGELGMRSRSWLDREHVRVHAGDRTPPQRRAVVFLDDAGERTITVVGDRMVPHGSDPLPWADLAACDAVYLTGGDPDAAQQARAARVLVATPRAHAALADASIELDALVLSASDPDEVAWAETIAPVPRLTVLTEGGRGGRWLAADGRAGRWAPAPLPGTPVDAYGAGDSFAAGLTYGLAGSADLDAALALAARCGAACLCGRGPYEGQLRLAGG